MHPGCGSFYFSHALELRIIMALKIGTSCIDSHGHEIITALLLRPKNLNGQVAHLFRCFQWNASASTVSLNFPVTRCPIIATFYVPAFTDTNGTCPSRASVRPVSGHASDRSVVSIYKCHSRGRIISYLCCYKHLSDPYEYVIARNNIFSRVHAP
jgi:hypothetical protein